MEMASNNPHRTQFPVTEKSISLDIKGTKTDIIISKYTDSFLVMATQIGSMGTGIRFSPFSYKFHAEIGCNWICIYLSKPTQELRDSFRFKSYLLISRIYERDPNKPKGKRSVNQDEPVIYIKAEDEIFHELKNYRQMGQVLVVKADDVPKFRENFLLNWLARTEELKFVCVISLDKYLFFRMSDLFASSDPLEFSRITEYVLSLLLYSILSSEYIPC
uniref:Uncharacterized protein n=1 Tax=Ananas comosus var. bracteatus TaxID=296719 RepID=A0A6V7QQG9_ANACO|nr:unnamed protein product [Ananas comosus var. bracteatus]